MEITPYQRLCLVNAIQHVQTRSQQTVRKAYICGVPFLWVNEHNLVFNKCAPDSNKLSPKISETYFSVLQLVQIRINSLNAHACGCVMCLSIFNKLFI